MTNYVSPKKYPYSYNNVYKNVLPSQQNIFNNSYYIPEPYIVIPTYYVVLQMPNTQCT